MTPPRELKFAVVIPAYNESESVRKVVESALRHAATVIVVDDGSQDATAESLSGLPIALLSHSANRGKAASLWLGMRHALSLGVDAVVTMDADGQHDAAEIPRLVAAARRSPGRIVIGARLADWRRIPLARYCANRFANFWIAWAAGQPLEDSQSGFRLYPAPLLRRLSLAHGRARSFVFESEILIEASRLGCASVAVPVAAIYPRSARRSHFRPVLDVLRIGHMLAGKLLVRGLHLRGLIASLKTEAGAAAARDGEWYKS